MYEYFIPMPIKHTTFPCILLQETWTDKLSNRSMSKDAERLNICPSLSLWCLPQEVLPIEDDVVCLREEPLAPLKWLLGCIIQVHPGKDRKVCVVTVKTAKRICSRPVIKVVPLSPKNWSWKPCDFGRRYVGAQLGRITEPLSISFVIRTRFYMVHALQHIIRTILLYLRITVYVVIMSDINHEIELDCSGLIVTVWPFRIICWDHAE